MYSIGLIHGLKLFNQDFFKIHYGKKGMEKILPELVSLKEGVGTVTLYILLLQRKLILDQQL